MLLSNEYTNNTQVLKFICKCKNKIDMTFKKYLVQKCCDSCHSITLQRRFKYTFKECQKIFSDQKCILVSTEYKNQNAELEYICKCKNQVKTSLKIFLKYKHCKQCGIKQRKSTNLKKYGNINPANSEELKTIWIEKVKNKTIEEKEKTKEKRKKTNIIKYGVEHILQSKEIRQKGIETNLEKYGVEFTLQVSEIRQKGIETCLSKYGVEHPLQNQKLLDKMIETNLVKYGVKYTSQNSKVHDKQMKYMSKKYIFPSGKIVKVQGYENFALDILLKTYQEKDILTNRIDMPEIWYNHFDKKRRYFSDIYIEKENKIIEIKSLYTYKQNLIQNICKALGTRKYGYDYEIWIMAKNKLIYVI
jgi:hypothetical protein